MKDTIITVQQKKRELYIWLACLIAAFLFNIVAMLIYSSPVKELITQLHIVIILSFFFYFVVLFFRILGWLILKIFRKNKAASGVA